MTTLNTIIEEEKKEFEEKWPHDGTPMRAWPYNAGGGNWLHPYSDEIKAFLTTAMQRAYEASKVEEQERAFNIIHQHAMQTKDVATLDLLEKIQKEIWN